jgi:hypothetical protein
MNASSLSSTVLRRRLALLEQTIDTQERAIAALQQLGQDTAEADMELSRTQGERWCLARDLTDGIYVAGNLH